MAVKAVISCEVWPLERRQTNMRALIPKVWTRKYGKVNRKQIVSLAFMAGWLPCLLSKHKAQSFCLLILSVQMVIYTGWRSTHHDQMLKSQTTILHILRFKSQYWAFAKGDCFLKDRMTCKMIQMRKKSKLGSGDWLKRVLAPASKLTNVHEHRNIYRIFCTYLLNRYRK